jgi:predicted RNase H-like HicB family nuclease
MAQTLILTPLYEPAENGWTDASIRELPAVVTCAPPGEDIREWLADALREYCLALQDQGEPLPLGAATVDDLVRGLV